MPASFARPSSNSTPLIVLARDDLDTWKGGQSKRVANWVNASGFSAALGAVLVIPKTSGGIKQVLVGWGRATDRKRGRFHMASAAKKLPKGKYHIESGLNDAELEEAALGWLLSEYNFDRYKSKSTGNARLIAPPSVSAADTEAIAAGEFLTRDLINTPTSDMGPNQLETAFLALGNQFNAKTSVIVGEELLNRNLPMIHAVGRASDQQPRLLDLRWGKASDPTVTLVGKGVCFDTGGLNIKPGSSMGLMKKDMGGAANVMGLANIIMSLKLGVNLRVLVPAVENSISAGAFRPQDILKSRKGLTVEINNTDAEGRLVLADALALADEEKPDLLVSMATLTGAARVALGPDVSPFYTDGDDLAAALSDAGRSANDPVWRMPLWEAYESMIEPSIADLDNAPSGGFAGSITAALFLRRFVEHAHQFVHFDIYGWTPSAKPARPKGGAFQGGRALLSVIMNHAAK